LKIAVYGPTKRTGILVDGNIADLRSSCAVYLRKVEHSANPNNMADELVGDNLSKLMNGGQRALTLAKNVAEFVRKESDMITGVNGERIVFKIGEVKLQPPLTESSKIMCYGGNFADHMAGYLSTMEKEIASEDARKKILESPMWGFYKLSSNFIGHEDSVQYPSRAKRLDYEGEIAAVIGRKAKGVNSADHMKFIFGYTIFTDFSIRDNKVDQGGIMNFALIKNFDGSGSLGPWIVTSDEISDPYDLDIVTKINGVVKQNGNTRSMVRNFGELMQHVSTDMTLYPGDILTSGTPAGTAADSTRPDANGIRDPSKYLKVGDLIEVSSQKIGLLRNNVIERQKLTERTNFQ